ncbi:hypothetical protein ACMA1D_01875 [Streptomyces sp. 796.1]|uniref:hypothetical protein n=1 Tax=Streptomyces sp. 796.1 TaxID=3163029 RepID=UPI0039C8DCC1
MPLIVDPLAPPVVPPTPAVSPDGWLTAVVDPVYAGVVLGVDYTAGTPLAGAADVRKIRITRLDPGAAGGAPVRSADSAWAVGGVGVAYDHEAPLGVAVAFSVTPTFADGSTGPASSVSVTVPAPTAPADVWIKSIDTPDLAARVTVTAWPSLAWAARIDQADIAGSAFPVTSQDVYSAAASDITIDADGPAIEVIRRLLTTPGVRLIQTVAGYHRPDMYVLLSDPAEGIDTTPDGARTFTAGVVQVARPSTAGQPLRMPGWSFDVVAGQYATFDAVAAAFSTFAALATNGAVS